MRKKRPTLTVETPRKLKQKAKLPNIWQLTKITGRLLKDNLKLFVGITLVYGFLNIVFAQALSGGGNIGELKQEVGSGLGVFAVLVSSAGSSTNSTAGAYQFFLALIGSLAIIWSLRQILAGTKVGVRDAYYRGMYPLVPFVLVLFVIALQLIPLMIGSGIYSLVVSNGIAVGWLEKGVWGLLYLGLASISGYFLTSSLFAAYIVTLPDMTPIKALRSARELVKGRRWAVLRKVLALPIIILVVAAAIMLPIIIALTPLAQAVFFVLTMSSLTVAHTYMYTLYRELLNE